MPRRFGPTLGAGTVIIEKEAGKQIQPAPTGTTIFVGRFEKGNPGELIDAVNQRGFLRKLGTYIDDSEAPDAAFDLFNLSNGAASLYCVRITDGLEEASRLELFSRHSGAGEYLDRDAGANAKTAMLTIDALNGGRWGGAFRGRAFSFTPASDLTETTLDTGLTLLEDELAGATLRLEGVSSTSYSVISNTVAGVLTVSSDSTMATDLADGDDPTNGDANVFIETELREYTSAGQRAGDRRALSINIVPAEDTDGNYFGMHVFIDGSVVRKYANLSMDSSSKYYVANVINEDPDNDFIEVTVDFSGDPSVAANRPVGWFGRYRAFSSATISTDVCFPRLTTQTTPADDVGFIGSFVVPAKCQKMRLTVEFTGATTFKVYADDSDGYGFLIEDGALATGTVGTAWTPSIADDLIPGFTVYAGPDSFTTGDEFTIEVDPLPVDISSGDGSLVGFVYTDSGSLEKTAIESNGPDSIVLKSAPATTPNVDETLANNATSEVTVGTAITFSLASATYSINYVTSSGGYTTVTTATVAPANIGALVTALNSAEATAGRDEIWTASSTVTDALAIDLTQVSDTKTGLEAFIHVIDGTADLEIVETGVSGDVGDSFIVSAGKELVGGYDGSDPTDADYLTAFNTVTSPINRLAGRNLGLAKIATPGVTSTNVQKGGLAYAEAKNHQYRVEVPAATTSETSAVSYINSTIGRNDYGVVAWPSYGYVVNPLGEGLVLRTLTGAIMGREAGVARDFGGYHKAAAGQSVTIPNMIRSTLDGAVIDEETTNPNGLAVIKKLKGNFVIWGDRTISLDPGWKWKHQREQMSHYEHQLQEAFDYLIFAINDAQTQAGVLTTLQAFFLPEWQKRALRGATFDDAVTIKIDDENNTDATRAAGDLNAEISLRLADTVERFIITIGKKGIFDQAG